MHRCIAYEIKFQAVVVADKQRAEMLYNIVKRDNEGHGVKNVNWHQVWDGFTAGLDSPFCDYFYETSVAFPDAKVILTTRDPQAWWHSCKSVSGWTVHFLLKEHFEKAKALAEYSA